MESTSDAFFATTWATYLRLMMVGLCKHSSLGAVLSADANANASANDVFVGAVALALESMM